VTAQPHDLVRIDPGIARSWAAPAWVAASLAEAPWVVVRRGPATPLIPVGVRGATRTQRFAANIAAPDAGARLTPIALLESLPNARTHRVAHAAWSFASCCAVRNLCWGPIGAFGFELASGIQTTHTASDLDIALHAGSAPCAERRARLREVAAACAAIERAIGVRVDVEVTFGDGPDGAPTPGSDVGIALHELLSGAPVVLAKTRAGPQLLANPLLSTTILQ
jgi:phosphoribosyl-dephospho-CoA transferase